MSTPSEPYGYSVHTDPWPADIPQLPVDEVLDDLGRIDEDHLRAAVQSLQPSTPDWGQ